MICHTCRQLPCRWPLLFLIHQCSGSLGGEPGTLKLIC